MPELSIVVPAYRERDNVLPLLDGLERALAGRDWEAIFVVDDAADRTEEVVRERAQRDPRVRVVHRIGRRGLASACIEGMLASSAPYLAVIDADLQHDERLIPELLARLRDGEADIVVASRYLEGASTGELAAARVRLSRLASALSRVLTRELTDPMSGFFIVRRAFLERVVRRLYGRGFKILLDLIAAAVGATGLAVHLAVLWLVFHATGAFLPSQIAATWVAMTSNFFLNNAFTYSDQGLRGRRLWRGLASFYLACGIGALINVAMAEWLFLKASPYWAAGMAGALIAALWNFFTTASFTWGGSAPDKR